MLLDRVVVAEAKTVPGMFRRMSVTSSGRSSISSEHQLRCRGSWRGSPWRCSAAGSSCPSAAGRRSARAGRSRSGVRMSMIRVVSSVGSCSSSQHRVRVERRALVDVRPLRVLLRAEPLHRLQPRQVPPLRLPLDHQPRPQAAAPGSTAARRRSPPAPAAAGAPGRADCPSARSSLKCRIPSRVAA